MIRTLIRLSLLSQLTSSLDCSFRAVLLQILVRHNLATHKLVLEIGVDDAGSLGRLGALADSPCAHFSGADSEVPYKLGASEIETRANQGGRHTLRLLYPACVILGRALTAPTFSSSAFFSSGVESAERRSSKATEKGMSGSPGLFSSIQALILGNHLFFFLT